MIANEQIAAAPGKKPRWLKASRVIWPVCAAMALIILILSIVAQLTASADTRYGLLTTTGSPFLNQALNIAGFLGYGATAFICILLATLLFIKRQDDAMAHFLAYFLLVYGLVMAGPIAYLEPFLPGSQSFNFAVLVPGLFGPLLVVFLAIFPNGQVLPGWARWLAAAAVLYGLFSPIILNNKAYNLPMVLSVGGVILWFGLLAGGLFAQIQRFRFLSDPVQRQQTKWVIYGFVVALLLVILLTAWTIIGNYRGRDDPLSLMSYLIRLLWSAAILVLPVTLTLAILRYRLYDVEFFINRTLIYGALTAAVIAVYVLIVGGLGSLLQAQDNLLLALIATGLIAVLFQPLRDRLQQAVNRLMYGERDQPFEALSRLGRRLEDLPSPDMVYTVIVEAVAQALKLPYAAIAVRRGERTETAEAHGNPGRLVRSYPLMHQGEFIGELQVSPRREGEQFSAADERLLRNFARQVGAAVYAAELLSALQLSRQQLVSAREEERRRLRRDLHDGLGPALASVVWQAEGARDLMESDPIEGSALLESSIDQARSALADIRRLVYELRPPALDELGLVGALKQTARQYRQMDVTIDAPNPLPPLPAAVEVAAYRIALEALKNAVDHGQAAHCQISLSLNGDLILAIRDDGSGLPPGYVSGVGLLSMRERAEELGGVFTIRRRGSGGTAVEVRLPLERGG